MSWCLGVITSPTVSCSSQMQAASSCTPGRHSSTVHSPAMQAPVANSWGQSLCLSAECLSYGCPRVRKHTYNCFTVLFSFCCTTGNQPYLNIYPLLLRPLSPHAHPIHLDEHSSLHYTAPSH